MEALMTPNELREYLNISRSTLTRMLDAGLPHIGYGRLRRFERDTVLQWYACESDSEDTSTSEPIMLPAGLYACNACGVQAAFREPHRADRLGACKACGGHAIRVGDLPRHM